MRWSVSVQADGDRTMEVDEIVALADAVATMEGIASGIGTMSYGAQVVVEADTNDQAIDLAAAAFLDAATVAKLPPWPVARAEAISYESEFEEEL